MIIFNNFHYNSSFIINILIISSFSVQKHIKYILTKRLDIRQKRKCFWDVYNKFLCKNKIIIFFVFLLIAGNFNLLFANPHSYPEKTSIVRKCVDIEIPLILLENTNLKTIPLFFSLNINRNQILVRAENVYLYLIQRIRLLKKEYNIHIECKDIFIKKWEEEKKLLIFVLNLYLDDLEKKLVHYLQQTSSNSTQILTDFKENRITVLETYSKRFQSLILNITDEMKPNPYSSHLSKEDLKDIKSWNYAYYIAIYELFYHLPTDFVKTFANNYNKIPENHNHELQKNLKKPKKSRKKI